MSSDFTWIPFYMEFADKLCFYKNRRSKLVEIIKDVYKKTGLKFPTLEKDGNLFDIDPFTVFGLFNKGITDSNRITIAATFKNILEISADLPVDFNGIPVLNNMSATFYGFIGDRKENDIDNLWDFFTATLTFADEKTETNQNEFCKLFDIVKSQYCVKWNLTMGLYWIRPYKYLSLDSQNRDYLKNSNVFSDNFSNLITKKVKNMPTASDYLSICDLCLNKMQANDCEFNDFPSLSYYVWHYYGNKNKDIRNVNSDSPLNQEQKKTQNDDMTTVSNAKFLKYFSPLLQALRTLGGSASKKKACEKVIEIMNISDEEISVTYEKSGESIITNQIAWARNYLVYEGMISNETIGVWSLTELGMKIDMTLELASHIFSKWYKIKNAKAKGLPIPTIDITKYYTFITHNPKYTKDNFIKDVFLTEQEYDKLHSLLLRKKNIILQGAPGVGKTYSAKRLAYSIIGEKNDNRICMVQFHQSYSYEDFIFGYRPNEDGGFEPRSGVFYNFCDRCKENPDEHYFFIIDEINRGNLSKIFGELLMLIETDKRGEGNSINLVYGGKPFYIPKNLHIIGMMNTADRSLAMIDYALRRRFSFYTMKPAFDNANINGFSDYVKGIECVLYHTTIDKVKTLNQAIRNDTSLGKGFEIGHSYFIAAKNDIVDDDWVREVVEYEIIPLIEEYWFDDDKTAEFWTSEFRQIIGDYDED